jgi:hypothetical protein
MSESDTGQGRNEMKDKNKGKERERFSFAVVGQDMLQFRTSPLKKKRKKYKESEIQETDFVTLFKPVSKTQAHLSSVEIQGQAQPLSSFLQHSNEEEIQPGPIEPGSFEAATPNQASTATAIADEEILESPNVDEALHGRDDDGDDQHETIETLKKRPGRKSRKASRKASTATATATAIADEEILESPNVDEALHGRDDDGDDQHETIETLKKRPGRPRKASATATATAIADDVVPVGSKEKRGPGRPRKASASAAANDDDVVLVGSKEKRGPGRPRKEREKDDVVDPWKRLEMAGQVLRDGVEEFVVDIGEYRNLPNRTPEFMCEVITRYPRLPGKKGVPVQVRSFQYMDVSVILKTTKGAFREKVITRLVEVYNDLMEIVDDFVDLI